ncbi:2OG-Fe(II) oxygenase [Ruegeria sp.]|uniref:2OG-Fe(II) oxygenase n=1 Tax=Ruegeria sp. TaxID=1879320 RepID=UPI002323156D|nr:2OG-Fe(II) oxygenase [Ruegeria sp.]MDA7967074.1 2OG-Fe(II) oxygenase [Ruegeria sp.]
MQINELLNGYVFELVDFLPVEICDRWITDIESTGFEPALINGVNGATRRPDIRNNDRLIRDDAETAQNLWQSVLPFAPQTFRGRTAAGLNERLRFYRYDVGQMFDWHQDGYFERPSGERSLFTFMIYLNDDFKGGGTSFCDVYAGQSFPEFCVTPKKGAALLFYHPIMHRGDPVLSGQKYVMRTDIMYSPEMQ